MRAYRIAVGDTLPGIAARLLNDAERWVELVALNRLRPPFLSQRLADRMGPVYADGVLARDLSAGTRQVVVQLTAPSYALAGGYLVLARYVPQIPTSLESAWALAGDGQAVAALADGVLDPPRADARTVRLTLAQPLDVTHRAGSRWTLVGDPARTDTRVLGVGDTLLVPDDPAAPAARDLTQVLGVDAGLDERGQLHWDYAAHDLAVVSGPANVTQAVRLRLLTERGALPRHAAYGNALLLFLGTRSTASLAATAEGFVREALAGDDRLAGVTQVRVRVREDLVDIDLTCRLTVTGQELRAALPLPRP